ncbi:MAG: hypothetical protein NZT92_04990 [Abditibacteriales bacterium]|nr:hypothetical protein [Abditibacteriales bacterium]MDW8365315.1 hypothetical protein [Abditibacteriales bacterium]
MRKHHKCVAGGLCIGLALSLLLYGCSRTKESAQATVGTIYYTGPKVSKANRPHQGKMVQGQ